MYHDTSRTETRRSANEYNQRTWGTHLGMKRGGWNTKAPQIGGLTRSQRRQARRLDTRLKMWQETQADRTITETQRQAYKRPGSGRKH